MKNLSKVFLLCFITLFAFAAQSMGQGKNITGQVVDALNESMPGVNVQVKVLLMGQLPTLMENSPFPFQTQNQCWSLLLSVIPNKK